MNTGTLIGVWRGAQRVDVLDAADRGLAYGDGLFETMLAHGGRLPWWSQHRARLRAGARRLDLPFPEDALLDAVLSEALAKAPNGVIKLLLTRGAGGHGYAPCAGTGNEAVAEPTLLCRVGPRPTPTTHPVYVDLLALRLAVQPALAGMKHLNRLEQVLGAREAAERGLDDGLMADVEGGLTCSTRANLFVCLDGRWLTPPVDRAGVAGVARAILLDTWPGLSVERMALDALGRVDALFLANALRGILPVGRCGARQLDVEQDGIRAARAALAASHPGF